MLQQPSVQPILREATTLTQQVARRAK